MVEREQGLSKIHVYTWDESEDYYLPLQGETYTVYPTTNIAFNTTKLRYVYNSMTTPNSVMEFDMATKQVETLKEQEVLVERLTNQIMSKNVSGLLLQVDKKFLSHLSIIKTLKLLQARQFYNMPMALTAQP